MRQIEREFYSLLKLPVTIIMNANMPKVLPDRKVSQVREILRINQLDGVAITDERGRLVGIVTMYDLLKSIEENRQDMCIQEVMTKNVVTLSPNHTLADAIEYFRVYGYGRFPVVDSEGNFLGMVTPLDIIIRLPPEEIAARYAREEFISKGYKEEDIGVFLITPCTAKIADIKRGIGFSYINGAISVSEVYKYAIKRLASVKDGSREPIFGRNISWVRDGGESGNLGVLNYLVVDGVKNVLKVLDDLELGKLRGINFIEGRMCSGGCVGGPLNVQNPYLARVKIKMLEDSCSQVVNNSTYKLLKSKGYFQKTQYKPEDNLLKLGEDIRDAIKKMRQIELLLEELPGIDCGSCGAPNCRALAEDIVRGEARNYR